MLRRLLDGKVPTKATAFEFKITLFSPQYQIDIEIFLITNY